MKIVGRCTDYKYNNLGRVLEGVEPFCLGVDRSLEVLELSEQGLDVVQGSGLRWVRQVTRLGELPVRGRSSTLDRGIFMAGIMWWVFQKFRHIFPRHAFSQTSPPV